MGYAWTLSRLSRVISKSSRRYLDYLQSPLWQRRRRQHLESVDYWCEICRKAKACQVHHWIYGPLDGNEPPEHLCAVCVSCHHRIHLLVPENDNEQQYQLNLTG